MNKPNMNKPKDMPPNTKQDAESKATERKAVDTYFDTCKPGRPDGAHPTVMGMMLHMDATKLPPYANARLEAHFENLLCNGNAEAIHALRHHFGWSK